MVPPETYTATNVPTSLVYGQNYPFVTDQFKIVPYNYEFTILEIVNQNQIFWKNDATFFVDEMEQNYTIYGTGFMDCKGNVDLIGTGKLQITSGDLSFVFDVTQEISGKVNSACSYAKLKIKENGTLVSSISEFLPASYALAASFVANENILPL
jgi:hypothetical protein